jgi:hypothetical protein
MDRAHRLGQTKQAREHIVFFFIWAIIVIP